GSLLQLGPDKYRRSRFRGWQRRVGRSPAAAAEFGLGHANEPACCALERQCATAVFTKAVRVWVCRVTGRAFHSPMVRGWCAAGSSGEDFHLLPCRLDGFVRG